MSVPPSGSTGTQSSAASPRPLGEPPLRRLPLLMRVLALLSLCTGMWGAISSLTELMSGVRADRATFISRVRDRQLALYDGLTPTAPAHPADRAAVPAGPTDAGASAAEQSPAGASTAGRPSAGPDSAVPPLLIPLLRLPRPEVEHLSLLLGGELYEQLPVKVPLALLQILLSWLLLTGSLGVLRRQGWALSLWSWACMVNLPFGLLSLLVAFVHSRTLREHLGPEVATALARVSGRSIEAEQYYVSQLLRLYVQWQGATLALWALLLGGTALYLQRYVSGGRRP